DQDELRRLVPAVADNCVGGIICRADGYAKPIKTTLAYRQRAEATGVKIIERHPVYAIERQNDSWLVKARQRCFQAQIVVNCAGAWGDQIAAMIGDSVTLKAEALALMVTARTEHFIDPVIGVASRKLSFKQMQNGTVVIGGALHAEMVGDREGSKLDFVQLRESARTVREVFPLMTHLPIVRAWAGIEGVMPDKVPVLGASPTAPGVFHAFGFSAHGLQLAPIIGVVMADLVIAGRCDFDLSAFAIDRFQE
ncbi:MAG: FAD-binding oxidoreductase, partial [Deltaproteobacteria bacterium]|nr:FAD-binding oxidoreductase [Deltaproteobacteria bacterium]